MPNIPILNLTLAFIPALVVIIIMAKWSLGAGNALYAMVRMLGQLLIIGYFLVFIFDSESASIVILVLSVMVFSSSWIALRTVKSQRTKLFGIAFLSILVGGGTTLALVSQAVLVLSPWHLAKFMIPLAGMIFAGCMNSVSLVADRFFSEAQKDRTLVEARNKAFPASLIPIVNTLFAVGLVSLPGMMTGQILSGISPLVAVRYQIMVMCMLFGGAGITSALFLTLLMAKIKKEGEESLR